MTISPLSYDKKDFLRSLSGILALMAIMFITDGVGFVVMAPVIIYASTTRKPELLFFAIMLCGISIITNNYFMPRNVVFFIVQRLIMVSVGLVYIMRSISARNSRHLTPLLGIMIYISFSAVASLLGWNPLISTLKIILFVCTFFAFYGAANDLIVRSSGDNIARLRSMLLAVASFYIIGSVLVIPFPEISQLKGMEITEGTLSLFKGMTTHSQCLGPVVAVLSIILYGDLLFSVKKVDVFYIVLLTFCPYLIYMTSSRTGMAAYILGMGMISVFFAHTRQMSRRWKSKVMTCIVLGVSILMFIALSSASIQQGITKYIMKYSRDEVVSYDQEGMMRSRQFLIDRALENFRESPVIGNGFQVSQDMGWSSAGDSGFAHLLSASIEKGVWVYAVLEEGGVIGMFLFCMFAITAFFLFVRRKAYIAATLLTFMLVSNMAEFCMFSMSYTGGFIWAMIFIGATFDAVRNKAPTVCNYYMRGMSYYG